MQWCNFYLFIVAKANLTDVHFLGFLEVFKFRIHYSDIIGFTTCGERTGRGQVDKKSWCVDIPTILLALTSWAQSAIRSSGISSIDMFWSNAHNSHTAPSLSTSAPHFPSLLLLYLSLSSYLWHFIFTHFLYLVTSSLVFLIINIPLLSFNLPPSLLPFSLPISD